MLFPLKELIAGCSVTTVTREAKVCDALHTMIDKDFSYLPVIDDQGKLTGVISEQIIVRKYFHFGGDKLLFNVRVQDCQLPAETLPPDADMLYALRLLETYGAVIVVDQHHHPEGIVTDFDARLFFHQYSQGIMLCHDIEFSLRRHIEDVLPCDSDAMTAALLAAFGPNRDQRLAGRPSVEYQELTLWQHVQLITCGANWTSFEEALAPKDLFLKIMEPVRTARNQMAHFRGELSKIQLDALRQARFWLEGRPSVSALHSDAPETFEAEAPTDDGAMTQTGQGGVSSPADENHLRTLEGTSTANPATGGGPGIVVLGPSETGVQGRGKYAPLERWLQGLEQDHGHIALTFDQIEAMIGEPLPPSALEHTSWWANDGSRDSRQSTAWLRAGWRVESVDFEEKQVILRRTQSRAAVVFFQQVSQRFKSQYPEAVPNRSLSLIEGFTIPEAPAGVIFGWSCAESRIQVELRIQSSSPTKDERYAHRLLQEAGSLGESAGEQAVLLSATHSGSKYAWRLVFRREGRVDDPPHLLEGHKTWAVDTMLRLVNALKPELGER
jgi:CBS domain-containing protein